MPSRHPPRPILAPSEQPGGLPPGRAAGRGYIVRASELGSYAYCRRAWWLRYMADVQPGAGGRARLDGGHLRHAEHGRGVLLAGWLRQIGLACAAGAALLGLLWLIAALLIH
ncbi:MAG TPA: hypothetical protein VM536_13655 [Chloroflexia bacterium]|nr:hypothetical protein [Chloroflexia bacterium]